MIDKDARVGELAMLVGILIDTFIVRSLLVPSLISLFGRASGWPWARLVAERVPGEPAEPAAA